MRILLHICCGPCAIYCIDALRKKGHTVEGFFYNPNIHPLSEYDKRKEASLCVSEKLNIPIHFYREYQFKDFFRKITLYEQDDRCRLCWQLRLRHTAEFSKRENFDAFTTTLLISPYQDQDRIKDIATTLAKDYYVNFYYEDFRVGFRDSHILSKEMGLYHQKYCGCVYSERERYKRLSRLSLDSKMKEVKPR